MPANVIAAVAVGRLLEKQFNLDRRDAFRYALLPQIAGLKDGPALALSIALGRRNEVPPPPPEDRRPHLPPQGETKEADVPSVVGLTVADARKTLEGAGFTAVTQSDDLATVESQDPAAGISKPVGTAVSLRAVSAATKK